MQWENEGVIYGSPNKYQRSATFSVWSYSSVDMVFLQQGFVPVGIVGAL